VHEVVSPKTLGIYENFSSLKGRGGGELVLKGRGLFTKRRRPSLEMWKFYLYFSGSSIPLNLQLSGVKILKVHKEKLRLNLNYLNTQVFSNSPMTETLISALSQDCIRNPLPLMYTRWQRSGQPEQRGWLRFSNDKRRIKRSMTMVHYSISTKRWF
jgi:hypothetical protein